MTRGRHRTPRPPLWGRVLAVTVCGLAAGAIGAAVVETAPPPKLIDPVVTHPNPPGPVQVPPTTGR